MGTLAEYMQRTADADALATALAPFPDGLRLALAAMKIGKRPAYIYSLVKSQPDRFDIVRIGGKIDDACVGLAGEQPWHLDVAFSAKGRES